MKTFMPILAGLALAGCGGAPDDAAGGNAAATTSVDAVTAEAVADTQAANADATAAADAELDRLTNSIDDTTNDRAADPGSGKAKVVTY